MHTLMLRIALLWLLVLPVANLNAQDSGLSFLRIGPDGKSLALGDAGVSSASGAYATYWNPAGLAKPNTREIAFSHHIWIADVRTLALQGAFSLGSKTGIGLFVVATGAGELEARTNPGESDGFFNAQFASVGVALGRALGPVRVGVTAKYLSERIFTHSSNGYAFDFGLQSAFLNESLLAGVTYSNVGKMNQLNNVATELPRIGRAGIEIFPFKVLMEDDGSSFVNTSVILEYSENFVTDQSQVHVGVVGEVVETLTMRLGYLSNDALRSFSGGLGLAVANLSLDYALIPFEDGFGGPAHIMSLSYGW